MYNKTIFIFHRSLRLEDNIGLIEALKNSEYVIPIFILNTEQIGDKNKFRSINSISFMIEALISLNEQLEKKGSKLFVLCSKGLTQYELIDKILISDEDIEAVYTNKDYTKYSINRSNKMKKIVEDNECNYIECEDYLLHPMNSIMNGSNEFYSVFTPFYKKAITMKVDECLSNKHKNYISKKYELIKTIDIDNIYKSCKLETNDITFLGNRKEGLKKIELIKNHKNYSDDRNKLFKETTKLSPYIKYGIVSIREVYHRIKELFGKKHDLIRQIYWREFYYNISFNRPDIFDGNSFRPKYDKIVWQNNPKFFKLWKEGNTGYPIVDAGMRELNETGYMHNRTRLIVSNFLVKQLFIDWRKGEKYFATKLIDYDPSVNNGNWQFSSGSGADAQPYFRMINPFTQGEKHDPDCIYIKKWIKELKDVPNEDIHNWNIEYEKYSVYLKPCKEYDFHKLKKDLKKIY
jgi:deoxyribodipyrimidine photo-lyase